MHMSHKNFGSAFTAIQVSLHLEDTLLRKKCLTSPHFLFLLVREGVVCSMLWFISLAYLASTKFGRLMISPAFALGARESCFSSAT